jgi:hypothetical protein
MMSKRIRSTKSKQQIQRIHECNESLEDEQSVMRPTVFPIVYYTSGHENLPVLKYRSLSECTKQIGRKNETVRSVVMDNKRFIVNQFYYIEMLPPSLYDKVVVDMSLEE